MRLVCVTVCVALLGGCSAGDRLASGSPAENGLAAVSGTTQSPPAPGCATVASHSTTVGEEFTRSLADEAVVYRIAESKGQLMQQGFKRVRVAERQTTCEKHINLGPGLQEYHCVAAARICGT